MHSHSYGENILGKHTDTETDLQHRPCHLQYPEVPANLCLPSLRAHPEVRSDQLDLGDPEGGQRRKIIKNKE